MYLTKLSLTNFRCFEHIELDMLDRLAVLVGENDAGKTVILDAIAVLVGATAFIESDLHCNPDDSKAEEAILTGTFKLESHDTVSDEFRIGIAPGELRFCRRYTAESADIYAWVLGFDDADYDDFNGADRQKTLLRRANLNPASNEAGRREQFAQLVADGVLTRTTPREVKLASFASLAGYMPRIERVASNEYRSPDAMIQRTLQAAAASVMTPIDTATGQPQERLALRALRGRINKRLNDEVEQATEVLRRVHPKLQSLKVIPNIDFTRAVTTTSLTVNIGEGDHLLNSFGEGTKKRMWMGLMEWEQRMARSNVTNSVIRLYDEPDVNLHYEAQRQLFTNISSLACDSAFRTQCIVCTHAVTLIDRAPCEAINLIKVETNGTRSLHRIKTDTNSAVVTFFNEVGHAVGLSNTALFYERGFLLVEGDSEKVSIPIIYRMLYGRSMLEDGIILVNLHTCSAWRSVIEVMLYNRKALTHLMLDTDCREEDSSARITEAALQTLGCTTDFIAEQVSFIGDKEYEDAFSDAIISRALDADFPREDGSSWTREVAIVRSHSLNGGKFSYDLQKAVVKQCIPRCRNEATKPNIAASIAHHCQVADDVPAAIFLAISQIRTRAGLTAPHTVRTEAPMTIQ